MHYATSIKENKELSETFDLFHESLSEYHSEIQFHFQLICFYTSVVIFRIFNVQFHELDM